MIERAVIVALCVVAIALPSPPWPSPLWPRTGGAETSGGAVTSSPFPSPTLSHPARGFALVSTPRAGLVSPASTRRCVTDEH